MQITAHVVQKFPKPTVPSPDSFDPDLSKFGVATALPKGCKHVGNIESLRLQTLCDQFLHESYVGSAEIEGEIPRSGGSRVIAGATQRYSADPSPNKNQLRAGHDAIGTLPEGPYMFPVVFRPSCETIIEEFNRRKGVIQERKFKRKLSVKQQSIVKSKAGKVSKRLTRIELDIYKDASPKSERQSAREAFRLYAKVNGVPDNEEAFTQWWADMCNQCDAVRGLSLIHI